MALVAVLESRRRLSRRGCGDWQKSRLFSSFASSNGIFAHDHTTQQRPIWQSMASLTPRSDAMSPNPRQRITASRVLPEKSLQFAVLADPEGEEVWGPPGEEVEEDGDDDRADGIICTWLKDQLGRDTRADLTEFIEACGFPVTRNKGVQAMIGNYRKRLREKASGGHSSVLDSITVGQTPRPPTSTTKPKAGQGEKRRREDAPETPGELTRGYEKGQIREVGRQHPRTAILY